MPSSFDIEVPRQGDWLRTWKLTGGDGAPIVLEGCTFDWKARAIAGTGAFLASASIQITDSENGEIEVNWHGPDFDGYGLPTEIVRAAHDMKLTFPDGVVQVIVRGQLIIFPEVTA